jgi:cell division cycle protein 20 (cofactor of APC complex)
MDATDFENMISLDAPIKTSVVPRWERRAARQQAALTSSVLSSASDANINGSVSQCDRYIPSRSGTDWDSFQSSVSSSCSDESTSEKNNNNSNCSDNEYNKLLSANIGCGNVTGGEDLSSSRVLSYKQKAPQPKEEYTNSLRVLYSAAGSTTAVKKENAVKTMRHIPSAPIRVLDAPDLMDDYCKLLSCLRFLFFPYLSAIVFLRFKSSFLEFYELLSCCFIQNSLFMECCNR